MIRYVHHQLSGVATAVCASAVGAPLAFGVQGVMPVVGETVRTVVLILLGCSVLCGLLEASRLKWISVVRDFDEAVPLKDPEAVLPADYSVGRLLVNWGFLPVMLVPALVMGLALDPWLSLTPLAMALDWLMRAGIAARWEKRKAVLLWREYIQSRPWELSYSPPTPPSTRRAVTSATAARPPVDACAPDPASPA
ncbi:hypothetical protein [Streptomyces sp. NPDC058620]|uniref:hypothetical protein n=1 Tax=Streptomyces sp. NPDC058620 TaxID=3346560 RepID=UPI003647D942